MRVITRTKPKGAMRVKTSSKQAEGRSLRNAGSGHALPITGGEYPEHTCWNPVPALGAPLFWGNAVLLRRVGR